MIARCCSEIQCASDTEPRQPYLMRKRWFHDSNLVNPVTPWGIIIPHEPNLYQNSSKDRNSTIRVLRSQPAPANRDIPESTPPETVNRYRRATIHPSQYRSEQLCRIPFHHLIEAFHGHSRAFEQPDARGPQTRSNKVP